MWRYYSRKGGERQILNILSVQTDDKLSASEVSDVKVGRSYAY